MITQDHVKQTVLIVDDEPENIRLLAKALDEHYTIMAVTDGQGVDYIITGFRSQSRSPPRNAGRLSLCLKRIVGHI